MTDHGGWVGLRFVCGQCEAVGWGFGLYEQPEHGEAHSLPPLGWIVVEKKAKGVLFACTPRCAKELLRGSGPRLDTEGDPPGRQPPTEDPSREACPHHPDVAMWHLHDSEASPVVVLWCRRCGAIKVERKKWTVRENWTTPERKIPHELAQRIHELADRAWSLHGRVGTPHSRAFFESLERLCEDFGTCSKDRG